MIARFLALLLAMPLAVAAEVPAPVAKALARAGVPESAVSIVVMPLEGGAGLAHQPAVPMNPASVMKLATSYAALDLLGPAFTFKTDFLAVGELAGGVLEGDLAIRGGGDPKLTLERLWQAAHALRSRGLREIRGDVIVDRSYFAPASYDPAIFDNEGRRAYNVGPDAFLVNFHAIEFRFVPDGSGVRVIADPDFPNVQVASRLRTVPGSCGWWPGGVKHEVDENGLLATITFTGTYPVECGEKSRPYSLLAGPLYAEAAFRWIWSEVGGALRGKVREGSIPASAKLLHRQESEPLANLVRDMNKFSNNVMARHLFLALSAERQGKGEAAASERILREWLRSKGIDAPELSVENGAGLSRSDRVSASTLAALLKSVWSGPLMPEIAASLSVFGSDGTLRYRPGGAAAGRAHLKGGTLTGVQSIAGYVLDRKGRRSIVVMMVNHANAAAAQPALDALVEWVYEDASRRSEVGGTR
jgi:D-alanyl-D-alanine carboxypeptidase/D-alanyl-D-alanine-endopeptidase (penicillin-binding protein 4)